jgi:hypothetical protein
MTQGGWRERDLGVMPGIFHGVVGLIAIILLLLLLYAVASPLIRSVLPLLQ